MTEQMIQLDLVASARWLGRFRAVELALFQVIGEKSATATPDELAVFLSTASSAHGYRAALFEAVLPVSVGLPESETLTITSGEAIDTVIASLSQLDGAELLSALTKVIYAQSHQIIFEHLRRLTVAQDAPAIAAISRALYDIERITALAGSLSLSDARSDQAAVSTLARAVDEAGGLYGQELAILPILG